MERQNAAVVACAHAVSCHVMSYLVQFCGVTVRRSGKKRGEMRCKVCIAAELRDSVTPIGPLA